MTGQAIEAYWQAFIDAHPEMAGRAYIVDSFGDHPALADELGQLIVAGTKTATCSSLWEYEARGEELPTPGLLTLVLDGKGDPLCIIETVEVSIRPYDQVDAAFAYEEGEDDRSLEAWREAHWRYFGRVLPAIGKQPSLDMPLICERFQLVTA